VTVVVSVVLPLVPVMVTVVVPVVALEVVENLRVDVPVPVIDAGVKVAVTPDGRVLFDKVTAESNPPDTVLVIVVLPELPLRTLTEVGEALRTKPPVTGAVTVRLTVVVFVIVPVEPVPVPVMVIVYVPVPVPEGTVKVRTDVAVPVPATGLVPKPAVTPFGMPDADKVIPTVASKPFKAAVVIVDVPVFPWTTVSEEGEAEMEKLGPDSALISAVPFILPQPVTRS